MMMSCRTRTTERGGAGCGVLLLLALPFLLIFGGAFLSTMVMGGATVAGGSVDGTGEAQTSSPLEMTADVGAPAVPVPGGLGTGGLVEVNLPNVSWPKVPALDRRVAPLLYGTIKAIHADGIKNVTFNYFFRTTAQQAAIVPVGTTMKARAGNSDHERGTAIDVAGMRSRPDAGRIVEHFRRSGFSWLGAKDAAHFYIPAWQLGEADKAAFLKRQQQHYQSGAWMRP